MNYKLIPASSTPGLCVPRGKVNRKVIIVAKVMNLYQQEEVKLLSRAGKTDFGYCSVPLSLSAEKWNISELRKA